VSGGYSEVKTYSFISHSLKELFKLKDRQLLKVVNAISPDLNFTRCTLIPSLVQTYQLNKAAFSTQRIFEINRIIDTYQTEDGLPHQPWHLGILAASNDPEFATNTRSSGQAFLDFKGILDELLNYLGIDLVDYQWLEYKPQSDLALAETVHPYRVSTLQVNNTAVGTVAELSPWIRRTVSEPETRIFFAELDLDKLLASDALDSIEFRNISPFPSTRRDVSLWLDKSLNLGELIEYAVVWGRKQGSVFVSTNLVDEYCNEEGKRSATISLQIEPKATTLTDTQANSIRDELAQELARKFNTKVRE
jgi:phenylalanyl-tRNA synthetase beta chain